MLKRDGRLVTSCNRAHFVALVVLATHRLQQPFPGLIVLIRRRFRRQAERARLLQLLRQAKREAGLSNNINFAQALTAD